MKSSLKNPASTERKNKKSVISRFSFIVAIVVLFVLWSTTLLIASAFAGDFVVQNSSNGAINYFVANGTTGFVGAGTATPATTFDINGSLGVGAFVGNACNSTMAGTLRYNVSSNLLELCNSTSWNSLLRSYDASYSYNTTINVTVYNYSIVQNAIHYNGSTTYTVTGPSNVTIKAWGSGGYTQSSPSNGQGGGGGFAGGTVYNLVNGDTVTLVVGSPMACTYAQVVHNSTTIAYVVAGGGGQSGQGTGTGGCNGGGGGAGGGGTGGGACDGQGGQPGTLGASGTGGSGNQGGGTGGTGSGTNFGGGGGGGGGAANGAGGQGGCGWYNGGGGGGGGNNDHDNNEAGGGGGGGSSYITGASNTSYISGSGSSVGNSADPNYQSGIGNHDQYGQIFLNVSTFVVNTTLVPTNVTIFVPQSGIIFPDGTVQHTAVPAPTGNQWTTNGTVLYYMNTTTRNYGIGSVGWSLSSNGVAGTTWFSVTYGNGLFVATAENGSIMTSPDGINWTARSTPLATQWDKVVYGNGTFVAVSNLVNTAMTSSDGITWTTHSFPENNGWSDLTYGNGLFVAVSFSGVNQIMTSPDGITWTAIHAPASANWDAVAYGAGIYVATGFNGTTNVTSLMTSPDAVTWTNRSIIQTGSTPVSIAFGGGIFVGVAPHGTGEVLTSPDGITWTARVPPGTPTFHSVIYGNGLFVADADSGNGLMTSVDGINWINQIPPELGDQWHGLAYGNNTFVGVAYTGVHHVMYSQFVYSSGSVTINSTIVSSGTLFVNGAIGATAFWSLSDARYKTNITTLDITKTADLVEKLTPVSFDWNEEMNHNDAPIQTGLGKNPIENHLGFIAQDIEKVFPQLVSVQTNNIKSVEYTNLVSPAIAAVQSQQLEIESLDAKLQTLKIKYGITDGNENTSSPICGGVN